ncbi:amino acid adenylation domain-containing protein [Gordonia sp. PKS22-38]|uniref:Amino acid adenylation domain-containing protein n=1 Tax=Gordonia prachuapensis TaxID=3115651 RepID=A0ABU7MTB6_9ACTN|nr:amino acid adenylation domain-containing protein [Gordonia sp. PKS22-38]
MTAVNGSATGPALDDVLPLTPMQEAIVYHSTVPRGPEATDPYLILADLDLTAHVGVPDVEQLTEAVRVVMNRHAALRTSYTRRRSGQPVARVHSRVDVPLTVVRRDDFPDLEALRAHERADGIDLTSPPPVRFILLSDAADDQDAGHPLLMVAHHVAVDGWSIHRILDEIVRAYRGEILPPPRPISTFLRWHADRADDTAAWTLALDGLSGPTPAPTVSPLPGANRSSPSRVVDHQFSAERSADLRRLARESGSTLNTVIQVAWALVLADHNDSDDVIFGAVVSGRPPGVDGVDEMVGMLINTIPVRVTFDPSEPVSKLLSRVQREQLAMFDHHHTALGDIQSAVGMGELFNSVVVFESFPRGSVRPHIEDENTYPATLLVEDEPIIRLLLEYRDGRPELLSHVIGYLEALLEGSGTPIGRLDRPGRHMAAPTAGAPAHAFRPVAAQIADASALAGRRVAVAAGERYLGYRELDSAASRLASVLASRGVGVESVVAIRLPRQVELVVVLLAIARVGAAYLPIDPAYPAERIRFMLDDAAPDLVIDTAELPGLLTAAEHTDALDPAPVPPEAAAYLVYTSGSTGTPKGVVGTAGALANRIAWAARQWDGTTALAKSSIAFIDGTTEILGALAAGATVVLADDDTSRDATALARLAVASGTDQVTAVPSLAGAIADSAASLATPLGLRRWIVSGEPLPPSVADRLRADTDEVVNSYGSSEVAGDVATGVITDDVHVGTAVAGCELRVLDRHLRPVPAGVPGELYVAGVQAARGYHGRPDLTVARFVADPTHRGQRMYRSGDRALVDEDGRLRLLGRIDGQVKIRGNRVELGEVEATMLSVDGVAQAAVVAGRDTDGGVRLDAYYTGAVSGSVLSAELAKHLPAYMIPATWTALNVLPQTPGGKLDRRALPAPTVGSARTRRQPATALETHVRDAVVDVLGIDSAGMDDNFFDLGGHSLSATRVLTRLRVATGVNLTVAEVFDHPVLADIATLLDRKGNGTDRPDDLPHRSTSTTNRDEPRPLASRPDPIPLSPAQRRLWFQSGIDDSAYTVPFAVELRATEGSSVDRARLTRSLQGIVRRHEILRTRIVDGAQVVDAPEAADAVDIHERHVASDAVPSTMAELIARPFDLGAESPIRADLLRTSAGAAVLLLTVHHIAADEWSARRLFAELAAGHNGVAVSAPPIQFADHAVWQLNALGDPDDPDSLSHRQLTRWRTTLAGAPDELALPFDRPRGTDRSTVGDEIVVVLSPDRLAALRERARDANATMFMLVHAAVTVALSASGAGDDIVVGSPIAGRTAAAADDLIGMFVNTVALRTDLTGDPTLAEVIRRVRGVDLDAYAHQDVPFDEVVRALAPDRSLGRHPVFQTMVQYRDPIVAPHFDGLAATPLFPRTATAKFDLTFEFVELPDNEGIRLRVEYATELFDRPTVDDMTARVVGALDLLADAPDTRMAHVRLDGTSTPDALVGLPSTRRTGGRTLVEVFTDTAARTPERTAVVTRTGSLTYREIDQRSAELARRLVSDGVTPGDLVALVLDRSADLVVAILATLRAGAAYVPIDPDYPVDRVAMITADAEPTLTVDTTYLTERAPIGADGPRRAATLPRPAPESPAYVIFTSGSTGRPKGVTVSHANVVALLDATSDLFDVGPDDVWMLFHSYAFDFSVWELWGPLSTGGSIVVPDRATTRSPQDLGALIETERVSVLNQTPSAFFALDAADDPASSAFDLSCLRYVVFGGEALDIPRLSGFLDRHPHVRAVNMYGITEITVHASHLAIDTSEVATAAGSDVGRLLPGFDGRLLDQYLRPVPTGVAGELYLAGPQVTSGYLRRPGLTSTRFVADPAHVGATMYRTGDLFRYDRDGRLYYVGRSDTQVKIRGFRIELGEIRSATAAVDGVNDVAVITRPGPAGGDRILAYVVADVDPSTVRAALAERLPEHMVPAAVIPLDRIPLTVNGKTDVAALPEPDAHREPHGRRPTNDIESVLADVFADSLGIGRDSDGLPDLGIDDDFFELGGDSIISTTMVNRARRRGVHLTPRDVFTHRTIAGLADVAEWIDTNPTSAIGGEVSSTSGTSGSTAIPLLPIVHRLREFGGRIDRFNQSVVVDTPAEADRESLVVILQALLDCHEALRMSLDVVAGVVWSLRTQPPGSVHADEVLTVVPVGADDDLDRVVASESDRGAARLSPTEGRMVSATFLQPPSGTGRLILVIHHLAVDGVSRRIILDDLAAFHADVVAGNAPTPLTGGTTMSEFATAASARAADPDLLGEVEHWATVLAPDGDLVPGQTPVGGRVGDQAHHTVTIGPDVTGVLLTAIPARLRVGVTAILLGALRIAATKVLDTRDLIVDTERHGRDTDLAGFDGVDLAHTVGWLTTVAPMRLPATEDITDAITSADRLWNEMPSAGAGFGILRHLNAQLSAAVATTARPGVLFNYLGRFPVGGGVAWQPSAESVSLDAAPDADLGCGYPLEIDVVCRDEVDGPVLAATFTHLPDQLTAQTVAALAAEWRITLETLTAPDVSTVPTEIGVRT